MNVEECLSNFYKGTKNPTLKAMELVKEKYINHVTFVVGSFYIYGTVEKYLKEAEG